jgi:zinc protease
VVVDLKPEAVLAEVEQVVAAELQRVRTEVVRAQELQRALVDIESQFVWGLEGLMARADILQGYGHYLGVPGRVQWDLDRYRRVTAAEVQRVAATWLPAERQIAVISLPGAAADKAGATGVPGPARGGKTP